MGDPITENDGWCKRRFIWTIKGFKGREERNGEWLESNTFKICDQEGKVSSWYLALYPRGYKENNANYVSLGLHLDDDVELNIGFEIFLLDVNSCKKIVRGKHSQKFDMARGRVINFLSRDDLNNEDLLPGDQLTIGCDITLHGAEKTLSGATKENCQQQLCQDLQRLLLDKDHADVVLICGDKSLPCHTSILSARSPVFSAMF